MVPSTAGLEAAGEEGQSFANALEERLQAWPEHHHDLKAEAAC